MKKKCMICGALFDAPPSSKKITCSKACSSTRKTQAHTGIHYTWSDAARAKWSAICKAKGFSELSKKALNAAMALPEGQRGEQHRDAKIWVLIDPSGVRYEIVNLQDWARRHAEWFDTPSNDKDRERIARNIHSGFEQILRSRLGTRKHPIYTYKGWTLGDWPREKPGKRKP